MTPSRARARIRALLAGGALGVGLVAGHAHAQDAGPDAEIDAEVPPARDLYAAPGCAAAASGEGRDPSLPWASLLLGAGWAAQRRRKSTTVKR